MSLLGASALSACGGSPMPVDRDAGDVTVGTTTTVAPGPSASDPTSTLTTQDFPEPPAGTALLSDRDGNRYFVVASGRVVASKEDGGDRLSIPVRLTNPRSTASAPVPREAGYFTVGETNAKVYAELVADPSVTSLAPGESVDAVLRATDLAASPVDAATVRVWLQILDQGSARAFNGIGLPLPKP